MTHVSVCISTWNRVESLKKCLDCISNQDYQDIDVFIVDNHSNDNTIEMLHFYNKLCITYIIMPHSRFSAIHTINLALRQAKGPYVLILDDDAYMTDNTTISKMVASMDKDDSVAIVSIGSNNGIHTSSVFHTIIDDKDGVYFFCGACALFRKSMVGPEYYDESYVIYWNEPDVAARMWANGYRVVTNCDTSVTHVNDHIGNKCKNYCYVAINNIKYINKVCSFKQRIFTIPMLSLAFSMNYIYLRHERDFWKYLHKFVYGMMKYNIGLFIGKRFVFKDVTIQRKMQGYIINDCFKMIKITLGVDDV